MRRLSSGNFIMALCFVGFGVWLLLVSTGLITANITNAIVYGYPFLLVVLGFFWLLTAILTRGSESSDFAGLFFILFGGLLAADRLGYLHFTFWMVWKLWPFLLIYCGIRLLIGHSFKVSIEKSGRRHEKGRSGWRMVTEAKYADPNWLVEPINRSVGVADFHFDFTKAFIPDKETKIRLSGWVGDIRIKIPEDVAFSLNAKARVGDINLGDTTESGLLKDFYFAASGFEEATRKIVFDFDFKILDLRIDQV